MRPGHRTRVRRRCVAGALLLALAGPRAASAGDELQAWIEGGIEVPLAGRARFALREELRLTEDARRLGLHGTNVGVAVPWGAHLTIAGEFRQEYVRDGGDTLAESRPLVGLTWTRAWRGGEVSNRNRFELRLLEERDDAFRYRNRVQALAPGPPWPGSPRPFLADEIFVETGQGFAQNRLMSGLAVRLGPLSASLYYMLVSVPAGGWTHAHVAGLNFTWSVSGPPMMAGEA